MSKLPIRGRTALLALIPLLVVLGCDSGGTDNSYPDAGNHTELTVEELRASSAGTYNVTGYVAAIDECPEGTTCILPDSFTLVAASGEDPDTGLRVEMDEPSQLRVGGRYRFSIRNTGTVGTGQFQLVGYTELND